MQEDFIATPVKQESPQSQRGHAPRWMWTFADLMSLLFALFVLLLTFADFDISAYKDTMGKIRASINPQGDSTASANPLPETASVLNLSEEEPKDQPEEEPKKQPDVEVENAEEIRQRQEQKRHITEQLNAALVQEVNNQQVNLEETDFGVVLRFPSAIAFEPGGDALSVSMVDILSRVAPVLASTPGRIDVYGHTDNVPIFTSRYRSNWDLSTARSVSVIHRLIATGIPANRLAATGYAETQPLESNDTPEGRATNRRVEIKVTVGEQQPTPSKLDTGEQPG